MSLTGITKWQCHLPESGIDDGIFRPIGVVGWSRPPKSGRLYGTLAWAVRAEIFRYSKYGCPWPCMHARTSWPAVSKELLAAKYARVAPRCRTAWPHCWPQTALRQQRSPYLLALAASIWHLSLKYSCTIRIVCGRVVEVRSVRWSIPAAVIPATHSSRR